MQLPHHYRATVHWTRQPGDRDEKRGYSRAHDWRFDGGISVPASASPQVVPPPAGREDAVDPEEAFVAALSSCHMLFFVHHAARAGLTLDAYEDDAVGEMGRDDEGKIAMLTVTLNPRLSWRDGADPAPEVVADLHHRAHADCFLANSVRTRVEIAGV